MVDQQQLLTDATAADLQRMLEEDAKLPETQRRWPQDLAAILREIESVLVRRGMAPAPAFAAAAEAALGISRYGGGRLMYIPQGQRIMLALRDGEIWRRFNGKNHHDLAAEFSLTVVSVYEILREQRSLSLRKRQGRLFDVIKGDDE